MFDPKIMKVEKVPNFTRDVKHTLSFPFLHFFFSLLEDVPDKKGGLYLRACFYRRNEIPILPKIFLFW